MVASSPVKSVKCHPRALPEDLYVALSLDLRVKPEDEEGGQLLGLL